MATERLNEEQREQLWSAITDWHRAAAMVVTAPNVSTHELAQAAEHAAAELVELAVVRLIVAARTAELQRARSLTGMGGLLPVCGCSIDDDDTRTCQLEAGHFGSCRY